ncbi:metal ABC transporter permease [Rosistilla oblonga]|uniref:Manganese transport system membrane protein MntB n=1 Tax=Rosistilla oblonga TaxID=2527990 RepID=A0A518IRS7_9BACT|nr:metal ABC transporter permease [Rosistilla oblonga]QDV55790.1 Manganese transport system membrane protein MntB [Rosistilla oblonga]
MNALQSLTWSLDGWIIVAGCLCALSAALLGNFLVLRKMSMLGDAITHAVLPGLAAAFLLTGNRSSIAMFVGAVIVGVLTALFSEWIRGFGKVDEGASMGVVFTSLFALGLVMIVQAADHVDLDPGCVLYGAIELTPLDLVRFAGLEMPRVVAVLSVVLCINVAFVALFYKELKLSSFDASLATALGFRATLIHYSLMTLVAITAVASFESVGNILVVAMFVVPPAAALMLTDRLSMVILLSSLIAIASGVLGHLSALVVPGWFGFRSTSTSGMMAVATGLLFVVAMLLGPRHGVLVKAVRRQMLSWRILAEDVLAVMFRMEEHRDHVVATGAQLGPRLMAGPLSTALLLRMHQGRGNVQPIDAGYRLTKRGRTQARWLVRSHRLWEQYLVDEAGVDTDRLHAKADALEHVTDAEMGDKLNRETRDTQTDPHGSPIPPLEH